MGRRRRNGRKRSFGDTDLSFNGLAMKGTSNICAPNYMTPDKEFVVKSLLGSSHEHTTNSISVRLHPMRR